MESSVFCMENNESRETEVREREREKKTCNTGPERIVRREELETRIAGEMWSTLVINSKMIVSG